MRSAFFHLPPVADPKLDLPFQDDSCSTFAHDLLCVGGADARKYWFTTATENWLEVTEHMRVRDGSNAIRPRSMSPQELSQVPFTVYFHTQRKGDLVILPPRRSGYLSSLCALLNNLSSFSQTFHRGISASVCWERMTLRSLEAFIYHDVLFRQRYEGSRLIS